MTLLLTVWTHSNDQSFARLIPPIHFVAFVSQNWIQLLSYKQLLKAEK